MRKTGIYQKLVDWTWQMALGPLDIFERKFQLESWNKTLDESYEKSYKKVKNTFKVLVKFDIDGDFLDASLLMKLFDLTSLFEEKIGGYYRFRALLEGCSSQKRTEVSRYIAEVIPLLIKAERKRSSVLLPVYANLIQAFGHQDNSGSEMRIKNDEQSSLNLQSETGQFNKDKGLMISLLIQYLSKQKIGRSDELSTAQLMQNYVNTFGSAEFNQQTAQRLFKIFDLVLFVSPKNPLSVIDQVSIHTELENAKQTLSRLSPVRFVQATNNLSIWKNFSEIIWDFDDQILLKAGARFLRKITRDFAPNGWFDQPNLEKVLGLAYLHFNRLFPGSKSLPSYFENTKDGRLPIKAFQEFYIDCFTKNTNFSSIRNQFYSHNFLTQAPSLSCSKFSSRKFNLDLNPTSVQLDFVSFDSVWMKMESTVAAASHRVPTPSTVSVRKAFKADDSPFVTVRIMRKKGAKLVCSFKLDNAAKKSSPCFF